MTMQWTAVDEPCRFVGSRTLEFSLPSGTDASSVVKKLCRGVKATRKETQRHYGPVNYDNDGEAAKPNDGVTTTVRRLGRRSGGQDPCTGRRRGDVPRVGRVPGLAGPTPQKHAALPQVFMLRDED